LDEVRQMILLKDAVEPVLRVAVF